MRRRSFLTLAVTSGLVGHTPALHASVKGRLVVQPLGPGSRGPAALVAPALSAFYAVDVVVAEPEQLPKTAYYAARGRYRADKLLDHLTTLHADALRVLGVTSVDISTTKGAVVDWGILGLATIDGRACVASAFRCRRSARDAHHAEVRLGKTAVHELGHTFGLEHCSTRGCLLADGGGTVLTTDGERDLCSDCRARLRARGFLRPDARSPWT